MIDGEPWTEHPARFYCRQCDALTHPAAEDFEDNEPPCVARCWACGEEYACDECGGELHVSPDGTAVCQRDDEH
jgi:hypothetical protein